MASRPARGVKPVARSQNAFSVYTQPIRPVRASAQPALAPIPAAPSRRSVQPRPGAQAKRQPAQRKSASRRRNWWLIVLGSAAATFALVACLVVTLGGVMLYGNGHILPGVHTAGIAIGNLTREEAAAELAAAWASRGVVLRDGDRTFPVESSMLGISLDSSATALAAFQYGRVSGGIPAAVRASLGVVNVEPLLTLDAAAASTGLEQVAEQVNQAAVNAGVQVVNGRVQERPAQVGRALDVGQTLARLQRDPARELADGDIDLVIQPIQPGVTDASGLVAAASTLLARPLDLRVWDPVDDQAQTWNVPPETWSQWLTAASDASRPLGLRLALDSSALSDYLDGQQSALEQYDYLKLDESVSEINRAIENGQTDALLRVYHYERQHTVQPGETIISIAWDYGVPYPWLQQANPGMGDNLSAGTTLTIPSPDVFMDYAPVYGKRIVVSISQQRAWVYENGGLKWEWPVSTGIASSPTWPGIYQIISHEPNAYAGNWDLWMPNFMGVYRPIPGAEFTNGFHGFPTRDGYQLLWTTSLGTRVTYGCILLSNENIQRLYDWAEDGVMVEIQA